MSNVPKLRFKEFSGEWDESKVGKVFKVSAGGDIKTENVSQVRTDDFPYPIYANAEKAKGLYGYSNLYKSDANVVTVAGRGVNIGIAHARLEPFYPIVRLLVLKPLKDADVKFWEHQLNQLNLFLESTGVPQLTAPQISSYTVKYPSKQEQEKIATFLTSVDTKIEQLSRKEELLKEYKKGVMQKIFSGELRFKADDGSEFTPWEEKKLEDIGKVITGKTPSTSDTELWDGNIEFITPTDIEGSKYQTKTSRTVTEQPKMNILPIGTIVYTCIASIGKMSLSTLPSITNQQINSLIVYEQHNNEFVYYALLKLTPYIQSTQANTTLPIINKTEFSKFKIKVPCLEEQTKIANFLSSIDTKIEQVSAQLDSTKEFKKALLQQMFV